MKNGKGLNANKYMTTAGAFFTTYESTKAALSKAKSSSSSPLIQSVPTPAINALSSSAGEAVSCLLLTPAEVIKQNAQVLDTDKASKETGNSNSNSNSQGTNKARKSVTLHVFNRFKRHPWRLWSGYSALLGRNLPFTGLNFPIFEAVKGYLVERRRRKFHYLDPGSSHKPNSGNWKETGKGEGEEPVYERAVLTGIAASISGSIASVVTTPIDVVKTRMMLAASDSPSPAPGTPVKQEGNIWTVGRQVFKEDGVKGLFRGGAIRVVWTAVALSIYLSMYEGGRFYLEKRRARKESE